MDSRVPIAGWDLNAPSGQLNCKLREALVGDERSIALLGLEIRQTYMGHKVYKHALLLIHEIGFVSWV